MAEITCEPGSDLPATGDLTMGAAVLHGAHDIRLEPAKQAIEQAGAPQGAGKVLIRVSA